jgi:hypothetical protein
MPAMAMNPTHMVPVRYRNFVLEPAHVPHILLAASARESPSRSEEEQGLEKCVREQVEDGDQYAPTPRSQKHVTQLAHGRICQHALDIVLQSALWRRPGLRRIAPTAATMVEVCGVS